MATIDPIYLGVPASLWTLIFALISTIVLIIGVPVAINSLRQFNAQRLNDSMSKLLEEYRKKALRDSIRHVIDKFPLFEGTLDERVAMFVQYGHLMLDRNDMLQARNVVHKYNDIGLLVERGSVREADFFGLSHPRIIELGARLELVILGASVRGGYRWGMRVRRLRRAAELFYKMSKVYSSRDLVVGGVVLVEAGRARARTRFIAWIRHLFGRLEFVQTASQAFKKDEADLQEIRSALSGFSDSELSFLDWVI